MRSARLIFVLSASTVLYAPGTLASDFAETIGYAYTHHPALKAEQENVETSRDTIWEAYGGFMPTATANYDRGKKRFEFEDSGEESVNTTNKSLTVSQPLFRGGGTVAQIKTARALTRAEEARLYGTGQQVLLNSIIAYVRMVEATALLQINRDNLSLLLQHMEATRVRRQARDLTVTDVSLSEARLARAQADLHEAEGNYDSARATFIREIGKAPDITGTMAMPPLPDGLPKDLGEVTSLSSRHPNLTAAQHQEKAADSAISSRIATILPTVNLQGTMQDQDGISTMSSSLSSLREKEVMLRVSIPIYQSGAEYARLSQARHRYRQARNETADVERESRENALRNWYDFAAAVGSVEANQKATDAAMQALDGIQEEYKYGTRTVLDVLDTQQELFAARQGLIRSQANRIISAYGLLAAVGNLNPKVMNLGVRDVSESNAEVVESETGTPVPAVKKNTLPMPKTTELATPQAASDAIESKDGSEQVLGVASSGPDPLLEPKILQMAPSAGKPD